MSVLEIKHDLLRLVVETDDADLLNMVRHYFKTLKKEPISQAEMEAQESRMIDIGLEQIAQGKVMSHEAARKKIKVDLLNRKK